MTSHLFTPIQLAGLTLRNRIVVSPMCMYSAVDGVAQPFHLAHIGTMALSGAGLVIMEATGVEAVGRISAQLCSAITRSRRRGRQQILVMQAAQHRSGAHPEALGDSMADWLCRRRDHRWRARHA